MSPVSLVAPGPSIVVVVDMVSLMLSEAPMDQNLSLLSMGPFPCMSCLASSDSQRLIPGGSDDDALPPDYRHDPADQDHDERHRTAASFQCDVSSLHEPGPHFTSINGKTGTAGERT